MLAPPPFFVELADQDEEPVIRVLHLSGKDGDFFGELVIAELVGVENGLQDACFLFHHDGCILGEFTVKSQIGCACI